MLYPGAYGTMASLIADKGVVSSIPAQLHTFVESEHKNRSIFYGQSPPSADSRWAVVSYKQK